MLLLKQMMEILYEKDRDKQMQMIEALPEKEKEKLIAESERLAEESRALVQRYREKRK